MNKDCCIDGVDTNVLKVVFTEVCVVGRMYGS